MKAISPKQTVLSKNQQFRRMLVNYIKFMFLVGRMDEVSFYVSGTSEEGFAVYVDLDDKVTCLNRFENHKPVKFPTVAMAISFGTMMVGATPQDRTLPVEAVA